MRRGLAVLFALSLLCAACTSPPDKEIDQARAAIDAARAAGADVYARDEYQAAAALLKRSQDAVAQRDYRQALNLALDCREQAENAARLAADHKAAARTQAERDLRDLQAAIDDAKAKLKAGESSRARRRTPPPGNRALQAAEASVQKARAALAQQDYYGARDAMRGAADALRASIRQINQPTASTAPRRRR